MTIEDISNLQPLYEPLDRDIFWPIVEQSLLETKNEDEQLQWLFKKLGKLSPEEMVGFRLQCEKLVWDVYTPELWCAGYIMNGGCSDDGFEYFRRWVVSRGKDVYYKAKEDPDTLISEVSDIDEADFYFEFESFSYAPVDSFKAKFGKDMFDYIDYSKFKATEGYNFDITFNWSKDEPETMKAICPQLFERFWR